MTCSPGERPLSITERPSIDWLTLSLRSSALLSWLTLLTGLTALAHFFQQLLELLATYFLVYFIK